MAKISPLNNAKYRFSKIRPGQFPLNLLLHIFRTQPSIFYVRRYVFVSVNKSLALQRPSATYFVHRRAPKIVDEDVGYGRMRPQISIFLDRADIVEYELAVTAIVVAANASRRQNRAQNTPRKRRRRSRGHGLAGSANILRYHYALSVRRIRIDADISRTENGPERNSYRRYHNSKLVDERRSARSRIARAKIID